MELHTAVLHGDHVWSGEMADAYHCTDESGVVRTVFRYRIPFPAEQEAVYLVKYGKEPQDRLELYQQMARCIQRQVKVSEYLKESGIPSVLTYSKVEQARDEDGVSHIYLESEQVWPVIDKLISPSVSVITVLEILMRLAYILRDISKVGVVHRGLDLKEVYINADNKILLGGFFYSECPGLDRYPDYLPQRPGNLPGLFLRGEAGHQGTDIQTLAILGWNLFSGVPHDARLRRSRLVFPEYAAEEVVSALMIGLQGREEECNAFRRKLADARKLLGKTDYAETKLPFVKPLLKEFVVKYVPIPAEPENK